MKPGEISKSMGVDTKPAHKFEIGKFWVMADPKMPKPMFENLEMLAIIHDVGMTCSEIPNDSFERNIDISTADLINAGFVPKTDYDKDFSTDEYYSIKYTTFKRKIVGDIEIHVTDHFKFKDAPDEWDYLNTTVELGFYCNFQELHITKFYQLVSLIKILEGEK